MDPAAIGGLLSGIAALVTAAAAWRKARDTEKSVQTLHAELKAALKAEMALELRAGLAQQSTINPVVNISPTVYVAAPANAPATERTEGEAQLPPSSTFGLGQSAAPPTPNESSVPDPSGRSESES